MVNSTEHEICPANQPQITLSCKSFLLNVDGHVFSCSAELSMKIVLFACKPTVLGIGHSTGYLVKDLSPLLLHIQQNFRIAQP